ncbi:MAG: hypothetical protein JRL30_00900 [Deltaproteobacteria bacterium]|nr:hypothetical protein [Deltaproteobacteria bacterium]
MGEMETLADHNRAAMRRAKDAQEEATKREAGVLCSKTGCGAPMLYVDGRLQIGQTSSFYAVVCPACGRTGDMIVGV